jgi:ribonuclease PH
MTGSGKFIEVQGTAEHATFSPAQLHSLLELATAGIASLTQLQFRSIPDRWPLAIAGN